MPAAPSSTSASRTTGRRICRSSKGQWNFDEFKLTYFLDRTPAFEEFKSGKLDYWIESTRQPVGDRLQLPRHQEGLGEEGSDPGEARGADAGVRLQPAPQAVPGSARAPRLRAGLQLRGSQQEAVLRSLCARRQLLRQFRARRQGPAAGPRAGDPQRGEERGSAGGVHHRVEEPGQRHAGRLPQSHARSVQASGRSRLDDPGGRHRRGRQLRHVLLHHAQRRAVVAAQGQRAAQRTRARRSTPSSCCRQPEFERIVLPYVQDLQKLGIKASAAHRRQRAIQAPRGRARLRHHRRQLRPVEIARQRAARLLGLGRRRPRRQRATPPASRTRRSTS